MMVISIPGGSVNMLGSNAMLSFCPLRRSISTGAMPVWIRLSMARVLPRSVTWMLAGICVISSRLALSGGSRSTTPTGTVRCCWSSCPCR